MKTKVIIQQRMAGWLMFNGMNLLNMKIDLKDNKRKIYIFEDTERVRELMTKYNNAKEHLAS